MTGSSAGEWSPPGSAWPLGTETATAGEAASLRGVLLDSTSQQEDGLHGLLCALSYVAIISVILMLHFVTRL